MRRPGDTVFADLVALYYDALPEDDAGERKIEDIYSVAAAHLDLGGVRRRGVPVVRVLSPDGADGWQTTHSVVLAVTDDMPFLVDTMRMLLERHGLDVHLLVHPMLLVERDAADRLVSVALLDTTTAAPRPAGSLLEAWMEVEIDRVDGALADELEAELVTSVADVRRVVSDFDEMRERLHSVIGAHPALGWFEAGHLVFLGAVDVRTHDDGSVTPLPATGLGQLRPEACNADALAYVSFPTSTGARRRRDRPSSPAPTRSRRSFGHSERRSSSSPTRPTRRCSTGSSACSPPLPSGRACSTSPGSVTRSPPNSISPARWCTATTAAPRVPRSRACRAT